MKHATDSKTFGKVARTGGITVVGTNSTGNDFMAQITQQTTERIIDFHYPVVYTEGGDPQATVDAYVQALQHRAAHSPALRTLLGSVTTGSASSSNGTYAGATTPGQEAKEALQSAFAPINEQNAQLQTIIAQAEEAVRSLHVADNLRLLSEARSALVNGIRSTGRDRSENFLDALRLLQAVQNNPVGARDYVAWFNVGWIQWQQNNLSEAEEAFYQSARLSASEPAFQSYALQHLAHVKYLREQHEAAHDTGQRALNLAPERAELLLDVARYAARMGRESEALELLQQCFEQSPVMFAFSLGEPDLAAPALQNQTESLIITRQQAMTEQVGRDVEAWKRTMAGVHQALTQAEIDVSLPHDLNDEALHGVQTLLGQSTPDYFTLLAVQGQVEGKADALRSLVSEQLQSESASLSEQMERLTKQVEKIFADRKQWQHNIKQMELEARSAGYPLTDLGGFARWRLRMKKLEHRYNTARMTYQPTKENLAQAEAQIKTQVPALHETIRKLKERRDKIEAARTAFDETT